MIMIFKKKNMMIFDDDIFKYTNQSDDNGINQSDDNDNNGE